MLRNYIGVQKKELNRLRGDLTAYRQEAQTAFKQNVAYPRVSVDLGRVSNPSEDFTEEVISDITEASVYNPPSPPDAPSVMLSLEPQPITTTPPPVNVDIELLSTQGLAAEQPPAPIPLLPEPTLPFQEAEVPTAQLAEPLLPFVEAEQPTAQLAEQPVPFLSEAFPKTGLEETSLTEVLDLMKPPTTSTPSPFEIKRGGRRAGAGRPRSDFKSNKELRQILRDEYGIVGVSKLPTEELRDLIIRQSGERQIIYRS